MLFESMADGSALPILTAEALPRLHGFPGSGKATS